MDFPRLSKAVKKITVFNRDAAGSLVPVVIFDRRRKRKKQTEGLKQVERFVRGVGDGYERLATTYMKRHRRSNRKRKDGWLRDIAQNVARAGEKGRKKMDPSRILSW